MSQKYNTQAIKSTSEKKSLTKKLNFCEYDPEQDGIHHESRRTFHEDTGSYYRMIPGHIFDDPSLLDKEKLLYGLLMGLCKKNGYSWATNRFLAKQLHVTPRQIPRYLSKLVDSGVVFVEILNKFERKIYVSETFHIRDRLNKIYNNESKLNQRFDRYDTDVMGGMTWMSCKSNKDRVVYKEVVKKVPDKKPDKPKPVPTISPSATSSRISPPATTSVSQNKKTKPQKGLTEKQKESLQYKFGKEIADPVISRIEDLMKRSKSAYTLKDAYDDANKFCQEASSKKINNIQKPKKESKGEKMEAPDLEGQRQDEFRKFITSQFNNPENKHIVNLIKPGGGCLRVELMRSDGRFVFGYLNYNDPAYKQKFEAWRKEVLRC